MNLKTNLTKTNFTKGRSHPIRYIVIHYTANDGDTDEGNANYFNSVYRGASAHYFVDEDSTTQVVLDSDTAWHCNDNQKYTNGGATFKGKCMNANSIGIEMCSDKSNGDYALTPKTIENTKELVRTLMQKHLIPVECVIRHYDVSGKICPEPFVSHPEQWESFRKGLSMTKEEAKKIVKEKTGLDDRSIQYMADDYIYGEALIKKLAEAMGG